MSSPAASSPVVRTHRARAVVAQYGGHNHRMVRLLPVRRAAALVFPKVFFLGSTPYVGVLRLHGELAAGRGSRRAAAPHRHGQVDEPGNRQLIRYLGLAGAVPGERRGGRALRAAASAGEPSAALDANSLPPE